MNKLIGKKVATSSNRPLSEAIEYLFGTVTDVDNNMVRIEIDSGYMETRDGKVMGKYGEAIWLNVRENNFIGICEL